MSAANRLTLLGLLFGTLLFASAEQFLRPMPRHSVSVEMATAVPRFVQVAMAGGDRFLAANIAVFRAVVASTETMNADNYRIQGIVQLDAAWLNPAHEDNFYIAAAILSWNDQLVAANRVLESATAARKADPFPPFYLAFNRYYFEKRAAEAGSVMLLAADRAETERQRQVFQFLAARWIAKADDIDSALDLIRHLKARATGAKLKRALELRIDRLEGLRSLRIGAEEFSRMHGRSPASINELRASGLVGRWPTDPLGGGYHLDVTGRPIVVDSPKVQK